MGDGAGARGSLEHPYATNRCAEARCFHLQLLFTCTTRSVRRRLPRRYHLERARLSAAHGGSRALLETGIWLQPSLLPPPQAWDQDGAESTHERPGGRQGNFHKSPGFFSPDFISELIIGDGRIKPRCPAAGARPARPGSSPSPQRDGEAAERAASWRMEITPAASRADSCSREGRKEAELPMDIRHTNNGRALSGHHCSSENSLCQVLLLSHPCWEYL